MSEEKSKLTLVKTEDDKNAVLRKKLATMGTGEWSFAEDLMQEIMAIDLIMCGSDPTKLTSIKEIALSLRASISEELKDDEELKEFVLSTLPIADETFRRWTKKRGWNEALVSKVRSHHSFSPLKKLAVLDALYDKAKVKGDVRAMELYFKLSGDLTTEKKGSKEYEDYKEYNRIINTPHK